MKDFPSEFIYEPWRAPLEVQKTANCMVGADYPQPVINHQEARQDCVHRLRGVYQNLVSKGEFCKACTWTVCTHFTSTTVEHRWQDDLFNKARIRRLDLHRQLNTEQLRNKEKM